MIFSSHAGGPDEEETPFQVVAALQEL